MPDYQRELQEVQRICLETGKILMQYFNLKDIDVQDKSPGNPVSEADYAADSYIKKELNVLFPGDAILSEEAITQKERDQANIHRKDANRLWIIDPLDGTKKFLRGKEEFSVSIGLVEDGQPVLGGIYNPARDHLVAGGPATGLLLNGKEIHPPKDTFTDFRQVRLCISDSEQRKNLFEDISHASIAPQTSSIGSVAWKLALSAAGEYDLILSRRPKSEWDVAAGMALFAARGFVLLNENFEPIPLNQTNTTIKGLIGGDPTAIEIYRSIISGNRLT